MTTFFVIACGVLGAVVGSFVGVVAARVPEHQSLGGRSHCAACHHILGPLELVPIVGWITLRGRCRHCAASISGAHPAVELLCAALFAGLAAHFGATAVLPAFLVLAGGLVALAIVDLRTYRLVDAIVLPVTVTVVLLLGGAAAVDGDGATFVQALGAGLASVLVLGSLHLAFPAGMGFGDVKLAFVLGFASGWVSWAGPLIVLFVAALLGSVAGLALARGGDGPVGKRRVPFGPFLAAGALAAVFLAPAIVEGWSRLARSA